MLLITGLKYKFVTKTVLSGLLRIMSCARTAAGMVATIARPSHTVQNPPLN